MSTSAFMNSTEWLPSYFSLCSTRSRLRSASAMAFSDISTPSNRSWESSRHERNSCRKSRGIQPVPVQRSRTLNSDGRSFARLSSCTRWVTEAAVSCLSSSISLHIALRRMRALRTLESAHPAYIESPDRQSIPSLVYTAVVYPTPYR
jgi:hypothetical protein